MPEPEFWLRGPVPGVPPPLQPVAHALLQAAEDVAEAIGALSPEELYRRPGGAASVAFHCAHLAGATDRLLTYARGEALSPAQRAALAAEALVDAPGAPPEGAPAWTARVTTAIEAALAQVRATDPARLADGREVGRAKLPSTVLGLLVHAAEHAARHAGQIVTTARIVRGLRS